MTPGRLERLRARSMKCRGFGFSCALFVLGGAFGCGGDDEPPKGAGGLTAGTGGSSSDGGKAKDSTAPQFAGLASAQATGETRVLLSWSAATDNVTPASRIAYEI